MAMLKRRPTVRHWAPHRAGASAWQGAGGRSAPAAGDEVVISASIDGRGEAGGVIGGQGAGRGLDGGDAEISRLIVRSRLRSLALHQHLPSLSRHALRKRW